ncbi:hypothetical protein Trydic_g3686 [Trypoxylus dichotomus]
MFLSRISAYLEEKRLKKTLQHDCQLPDSKANLLVQFIKGGYLVNLRRKFRGLMICNEKNPRAIMFLKSSATIYLEIQNHLHFNYYMIHPFSTMRGIWEMFMMVVHCVVLIYIPIDVCFSTEGTITERIPRMTLDFICILDIVICFVTGFQDSTTKRVIMDPKLVAKRYVTSWFVLDLLPCLNTDLIIMMYNLQHTGVWLKIPSFLKAFRVLTLLKYMVRYRERREISMYKFKMIKMSMLFLLAVIWSSCTLYLIAANRQEEWIPEPKVYQHPDAGEIWVGLRTCFIRVVMSFLLISHGEDNSFNLAVLTIEIILISIGWCIKLAVTAQIVQIVMKYSSLTDKYYQMVQQFQEYMRSKSVPDTVQRRILAFFEFRFQRNYYKENEILGSLSNQLKQEILVNTYGTLLTNTIIFKDIPYALLLRISSMMKMEIYLPNDVVVVADTDSEIMYFIQTGMVAVYDKWGREVCHLADGSYFGEISLFTEEEKRSASVVSIDFCEMYTLNRFDFQTAIAPYPDIYDKIKKLAKERLKDFLAEKEQQGYIKDYAGIAKKDSTRESKTKVYYNV